MDEPDEDQRTLELLRSWHRGNRESLDKLLERDLPWIRDKVRQRLGPALRNKAESMDFLQDAMVEVMRYGPRFEVANHRHFLGLLARMIRTPRMRRACGSSAPSPGSPTRCAGCASATSAA